MKWFRDNIIQLILSIVMLATAYTTVVLKLQAHEARLCQIEKCGSPQVLSLKKDVRWIMAVMSAKWNIPVPKDE